MRKRLFEEEEQGRGRGSEKEDLIAHPFVPFAGHSEALARGKCLIRVFLHLRILSAFRREQMRFPPLGSLHLSDKFGLRGRFSSGIKTPAKF